ncbi:MAG: hypothetical protein JOZ38_07420 [Candidatus Eremiobacteraeota bacterium]|nr:hypothetical protein [Candidatus Eremiobacteraeota bacterium]
MKSLFAMLVMTTSLGASPGALPTPRPASLNAPPVIEAISLSSTVVRPGDWWSGEIVTSKNVASVELRSPSFSFSLPKSELGRFAFRFHLLDLPPIYRRTYRVAIIARNTPGDRTERDYSIEFR